MKKPVLWMVMALILIPSAVLAGARGVVTITFNNGSTETLYDACFSRNGRCLDTLVVSSSNGRWTIPIRDIYGIVDMKTSRSGVEATVKRFGATNAEQPEDVRGTITPFHVIGNTSETGNGADRDVGTQAISDLNPRLR